MAAFSVYAGVFELVRNRYSQRQQSSNNDFPKIAFAICGT